MDEFIARMLQTVIGGEYARNAFPILTHWGLRDQDLMIHSLGVSYWTQLGHELGLMGVCEIPAPVNPSVDFNGDDVRTDSIWFERQTRQPVVFIEFERFSGRDSDQIKLEKKVKNLLLAQRRWNRNPRGTCLILAYWSSGLKTLPDHHRLKLIVRHGFTLADGGHINSNPSAQLLLLQFVFQSDPEGLLRLSEVIRRGAR